MAKLLSKDIQQIFIKIILGLIALVFVFWGFGGYNTKNSVILASVNGIEVSVTEHEKAYDRMYTNLKNQLSQLEGKLSTDFLKNLNLKQRALDEIIKKILIEEEAKKLNLYVNNEEVKEAIRTYPEFQQNGQFNLEQYKYVLRQNRVLPQEFERNRKDVLLMTKMENIITDSVQLSEDEVLSEFKRRNEKASIDFIAFNPIDYAKDVKSDDESVKTYLTYSDGSEVSTKYEGLKDYFAKNPAEFEVPKKVQIDILSYENDDYAKKVKIEESEIEEYYKSNSSDYDLEEEVKASHILIKSEVTEDPLVRGEAKKKAEDLLAKIKDGADFAEIAKNNSQDEKTSAAGGDMGWFKRGEGDWSVGMVAFPMKIDEVSDVVALKEGFHIVKVTGRKELRKKELADVRDGIIEKLSMINGVKLIEDLTRAARKKVYRTRDVAAYAKANGVKLITPAPFAFSEAVEGLGRHNAFNRAVFEIEEGEVSDIIDLNSGSFIVKVVKIIPSHTPKYEEAVDAVKAKVAVEISAAMAERKANDALKKIQAGASLGDIAKELGQKIDVSSGFVRVGASAPKIGVSEELVNSVFGLSIDAPYPNKIFIVNNKRYLVKLTKREDINEEDYKKERPLLVKKLKMDKADKMFEAYVEGLMEKADIKIFKEI